MQHFDPEESAEETLYELLLEGDWAKQFAPTSLERGRYYADERRVEAGWEVYESEAGIGLVGTIRGSGRRRYDTQAVVVDMGDGPAVLVHCSCPVGFQCKHGVALIQSFLDEVGVQIPALASRQPGEPDHVVEQRWERWLDVLMASEQDAAAVRIEQGRQLGLFIDTEPQREPLPRVMVAAVWLRPSKSKTASRLVDPKPIQWVQDRLSPAPTEGWDRALQEQLMLLLQDRSYRTVYGVRAEFFRLSRPFHGRVLRALCEADAAPPIFHGKQTGPRLEFGPQRRLRIEWRTEASGAQRLVAELEGAKALSARHALVLVGDELWYLDPGSAVLGPVNGSPAPAASLAKAPPLPAEKVSWLTERMYRASNLPSGLAPPSSLDIVELPTVAPKLSMRLGVMVLEDRAWPPKRYSLGYADVSFDYHDASFPEDDTTSQRAVRNGQLLTVVRDRQAEQQLLQRLPPELLRLDTLSEHASLPPPAAEHGATRLLNLADTLPASLEVMAGSLAAPQQWWPLVNRLRKAFVRFTFTEDFPPEPQRLLPGDWHADLEPAGHGWFDFGLDVEGEGEGERLNLLPILRSLLAGPAFPLTPAPDESEDATWEVALDEKRIVVLPLARLRPLLTPILDWLDSDAEAMRLPVTAATSFAESTEVRWTGRGPEQVRALAAALAELPKAITRPANFRGSLRGYQAEGVAWLRWLALLGLGGILADDMGLGKTVQVLARISDERARTESSDPVLVVATTSLVSNWCAEAERFAQTCACCRCNCRRRNGSGPWSRWPRTIW